MITAIMRVAGSRRPSTCMSSSAFCDPPATSFPAGSSWYAAHGIRRNSSTRPRSPALRLCIAAKRESSPLTPWLLETFVALRAPAYRVLWYGTLLNFAALWTGIVARGFLAFDLTQSATALGALFLGFGIPMLLLAPVGGVVADRLPRKTVMVAGQWFFALVIAVQAVLILAGVIEIWMLFVGSLAEGAVVALAIPARQALIGDLVEDRQLGNAMALQQVSFNAVRIVAPTVAGALIAIEFIGVGGTYLLQVGLYAASATTMMLVPAVKTQVSNNRGSPLADVVRGVRYVRDRPALLILVLVAYAVNLSAFSYMVFIPAMVSDIFDGGPVELGVLTTAIAAGAFVASLAAARIADGEHAWGAHAASALMFGSLLMAFALAPSYAAAAAAGVAVGAAEIGFISLNQSLAMLYSHRDYYGRVQAVLLFGFALNGLIGLPVGILADAFGLRQTLFALGAIATALVAVVLMYSRRIDARADATMPRDEATRVEPTAAS